MPEISVIVPIYKAESTIERCVDSLRKQTFSDIEIILVDDGSPDRSGSLCDEFAREDPRIRVIHQKNGGVSSARNAGLDIASGKYLMFCDSDDYVAPEWCRWMYEAMEIGGIHMAVCTVATVSDGNMLQTAQVLPKRFIDPSEFLDMVSCVRINELWNKVFRTDVIKRYGLHFDSRLSRCEDVLFVLEYLRYLAHGDRLCYGSPPLYYYENTAGSLSKVYAEDYFQIELKILAQFRMILNTFGIAEEAYLPWYSKHAALLLTNVLSNEFLNQAGTLADKYRLIRDVVSCDDYDKAVRFGGMDHVAQGKYLTLLKSKNTALILLYCTLSNLKKKNHGG